MKADLIELEVRNETEVNKNLGIILNGHDNNYPERIERIVCASVTASQCRELYSKFIGGQGIENGTIKAFVHNKREITINRGIKLIARDLGFHKGAFVHVSYNASLKAERYTVLPYKNCRFGLPDDDQYSGMIVVNPKGWAKSATSWGIRKNDYKSYYNYNPNPEAIKKQMENDGGIEKYRGQVMFISTDFYTYYPLSPVDPCQDDADTEYQISIFKNRIVRNGFITDKNIFRVLPFASEKERKEFKKVISGAKGAENAGADILLEDKYLGSEELKEGQLKIDKISSSINDKIMDSWEKSISNNIRRSFSNPPPVLIDVIQGQLGNTSGESLRAAFDFYNAQTDMERDVLSDSLGQLFANYKTQIGSTEIIPLEKIVEDEPVN